MFAPPSLPGPPGICTEMLKAHLPVQGDFLQSQIPSPRYRLQTSQDYRGSYFPWKSFHTMLGAKSGSRALPHLHLQGWELPSTSNSYYFGVSWTGPGSQDRRFGGNSYFYFAIDSCLFKLKREALRCRPRELQGSTGTPDSVLLSFWDLHPLHSLALQAGPIPGYSQM